MVPAIVTLAPGDARTTLSRMTAEFEDPAMEQAFRAREAPALAKQAVLAILLGAALTVAFALHDWVELGPVPFARLLLAGRMLLVLLALAGSLRLWRRPEYATSGVTVTLLSAGLLGLTVLMLRVRPAPMSWHTMLMVVILLATTLAVPNRFVCVAGLALLGSAAFVACACALRPPGFSLPDLLLLLGSANAAALLTAYRLSRLRRGEFAQLVHSEAATQRLSLEVTVRARLEQELVHMATTDGLTGLVNRRHFLELANRELARARRLRTPLTLCVLDVDHFKTVNDRFGHAAGDAALRAVADACRTTVREVDVAGRFGGEEFTLCLPDTDVQAAARLGERLREAVASLRIATPSGEPILLTVTLGFAAALWTETGVEPALHRADVALYEGKRSGRNRVVVAPSAR